MTSGEPVGPGSNLEDGPEDVPEDAPEDEVLAPATPGAQALPTTEPDDPDSEE
ncbi:MAG: hypothetical protein JWR11_2624 [Mycobacterium sp.]|jgi:hypothetical protein|nr:hypothetical protein [Mycobacterium sp.]